MASRLFNLARMTVTGAPGVSTITLGAAVPGFLTLDLAGVLNGQFVRYGAKDGNSREIGYATYNASTKQLTARVVENSTTGAILNLTAAAIISLLPSATDFGSIAPQCGQLQYVNAGNILFVPKNGNKVKINGKIYEIPNAGINQPFNNAYVNSNPVAALAPATAYLVNLFVVGGNPVINLTTNIGHSPSQAIDNEGVEIYTSDPTQTVIGLMRTDNSAQFYPNWVLSWFNKTYKTATITSTNGSTTSTAGNVMMTSNPLYFMNWAGDAFDVLWSFQGKTTGSFASVNNRVDSVDLTGTYLYGAVPDATPITLINYTAFPDGMRTLVGMGFAASGSGTLTTFNQYLAAKYLG